MGTEFSILTGKEELLLDGCSPETKAHTSKSELSSVFYCLMGLSLNFYLKAEGASLQLHPFAKQLLFFVLFFLP